MRKLVVLMAVGAACVAASAENTVFHFTSDPGAWIGRGDTVTVTPDDGFDFSIQELTDGVIVDVDNLATVGIQDREYWTIRLRARAGEELVVGTYPGAIRFNSPTNPGLDFSGNYRGNNSVTGHFEVLEIERDINDNVTALAVDFTQYDEGDLSHGNYGKIRIASVYDLNGIAATPATSHGGVGVLVGVLALVGGVVARRRVMGTVRG